MIDTLDARILRRELQTRRYINQSHRAIYGCRQLISSFDIVSELDGHSGCVNALSWSKSGRLLASGSDDQHLNIHTYHPESAGKDFQLTSTVATGHTQNIFSVKFMPHHNDAIVVTAAGDGEVRIFDVEYSGSTRAASHASSLAYEGRRRGRDNTYNGVRYLTDGDTDCKVYRSHGDRVKRIVTESSPHLFLTCSEDGEVRQWDLRLPSSAYPLQRSPYRRSGGTSIAPPALISYKRYGLDLNTISCSASQPHYIALGGAHLHAFLHDRRMTGRDKLAEMGRPLPSSENMSESDEELMRQATQCVRKFAPKGQKTMKRSENGHITACKISDARPNEMIVSWSRDHVYSFDLLRSPDAAESQRSPRGLLSQRKRKRHVNSSDSPPKANSVAHSFADHSFVEPTALRISYGNGQIEDVPLFKTATDQSLTARQSQAQQIARAIDEMRSTLFESGGAADNERRYTKVLGYAASTLPRIDEAMRTWTYPVDPSSEMVRLQRLLRRHREATYRFVQAAGTVARVMGAKLQTPSRASHLLAQFVAMTPRNNNVPMATEEIFAQDFVKAILVWLESGVGRLLEAFVRPAEIPETSNLAARFPIKEQDTVLESLDEVLIPYLLGLADDTALVDLQVNKFEVDENRVLYRSQKDAVHAFAAAIRTPFTDLSSLDDIYGDAQEQTQDREEARAFWCNKVARAVLFRAAGTISLNTTRRAFGGRSEPPSTGEVITASSSNGSETNEIIQNVEVLDSRGEFVDGVNTDDLADIQTNIWTAHRDTDESLAGLSVDDESNEEYDIHGPDDIIEDGTENDESDDDVAMQDEDDSDDEISDSDPDEEEELSPLGGLPGFSYRSGMERRKLRESVEADIDCGAATRKYTGHCNVKTVKDVNYFGLHDEYVVSGSDDGNFFIWDSKTTELVNVLEGDGEVVNVIQGHPYETMLAVSGIDHTIKIFSPDARAREAARLGQGTFAHDTSSFTSLSWPHRISRRSNRRHQVNTTAETNAETEASDLLGAFPQETSEEGNDSEADSGRNEYVAPHGLATRRRMHDAYRIMNQNDVERQGRNEEAYITREMLAELVSRFHEQRSQLAAQGLSDDGTTRVQLGEDCAVQ